MVEGNRLVEWRPADGGSESGLTYLETVRYQCRTGEEARQYHMDANWRVPDDVALANLNILHLSCVTAKILIVSDWQPLAGGSVVKIAVRFHSNQLQLDASDGCVAHLDRELASYRLVQATYLTVELAGYFEVWNQLGPGRVKPVGRYLESNWLPVERGRANGTGIVLDDELQCLD